MARTCLGLLHRYIVAVDIRVERNFILHFPLIFALISAARFIEKYSVSFLSPVLASAKRSFREPFLRLLLEINRVLERSYHKPNLRTSQYRLLASPPSAENDRIKAFVCSTVRSWIPGLGVLDPWREYKRPRDGVVIFGVKS